MTKKTLTADERIEQLETRLKLLEDNNPKRRRRDPNAPKKPPSAYNLFMKDASVKIRKENPKITAKEVMVLVGKMWREQKSD